MHSTDPSHRQEDREQGRSLLNRLSLPALIGGIALALSGTGKLEEAGVTDAGRVAATSPSDAPGSPAPRAEKPAFAPDAHMARIETVFDDELERKILVAGIGADGRSALASHVDGYLSANPPSTFQEHLKWQRHLWVLRACDPCLAAGYQRAEEESLRSFLSGLDRWKKGDTGLFNLDRDMRAMHRLVGALSDEGRAACAVKMREIEAELLRDPKAVGGYVAKCLDTARSRGSSARKDSEEAIHRGGDVPLLKYVMTGSIHEQLAAAPGFESRGKRWIYVEKGAPKRDTDWVVELDGVHLLLRNERYVTLRSLADPGTFVSMSEREFRKAVTAGSIDGKVKEARKTADLEERHAETLKRYDFPREGKIGYLRVFPGSHDQVVSATLQSSMLLSAALSDRYGERLTSLPPVFTESPRKAIESAIDEARAGGGGPGFFCIDIYNHGSTECVAFTNGLTASDLVRIAERYPECKFAFCTLACFGGGLREQLLKALEDKPDLAGRIALFTQTKPNMPNYLASTASFGSDIPYSSTNYYLHMIQALYDPGCKTFGEAVHRADLETQRYMSLDAECVLDGLLIGMAPDRREVADRRSS